MSIRQSKLWIFAALLGAISKLCADKGTSYPSEWQTLPALDSTYEVLQLTQSKALDCKMYLDVDPYVPSLNSVVFMSDRDGNQNLYLLSLANGTFVQLTDSDSIDGDHCNVSPSTQEAFFREKKTIKKVSLLPPYNETTIYTVDSTYQISGIISISSDSKTLAVSLYDDDKKVSWLSTIDLNQKKLNKIYKQKGQVDHIIINPNYSNQLLYHVYDKDQVGIVDIKSGNAKMLSQSNDHAVHPFWFSDGITAGYVVRQGPNNSSEQVVAYNTSNKKYTKYNLSVYGNHFAVNPASTTLQGDGSASDPYIYYYTINGSSVTNIEKMFKHNSSFDDETVHPHAAFMNDTDIIFNSDADGNGNVYILRKKV